MHHNIEVCVLSEASAYVVDDSPVTPQTETDAQPSEAMAAEDDDGAIELDLTGVPEAQANTILAVVRASGLKVRAPFKQVQRRGQPARAAPKAKARPGTPPRTGAQAPRPDKCGNCGGPHGTRACPNPIVPEDKRACFNCGKPGHQAWECWAPNKIGT